MGSPGPATLSAMAVAAGFGRTRAVPYVAGLVLGTWIVLAIAASGVVAALLAIPALARAVTLAAALYMLWLAWRIATAPAPAGPSHHGLHSAPGWRAGVLLAIANPKAYLAIAAVFAGARLAPAARMAVLAGMVLLIHLAWWAAGAAIGGRIRSPRSWRWTQRIFAAALVAATLPALLPR